MGAFLSLLGHKYRTTTIKQEAISPGETCKRQRMSTHLYGENSRLIPYLPDEISIQILARLPRISYFSMRLVAQNWKAAVTSHELFNLRKELGLTEEWLYLLTKVEEEKLLWHALDPYSKKWLRLPPMPDVVPGPESTNVISALLMWNIVRPNTNITSLIRGWLGHQHDKSSGQPPFCGCAIGSLNGCLYVLGGFSSSSAMRSVWLYDPIANRWNDVPPMLTGRAYCKTSVLNGKLYVVGGVNQGRGGLTPLKSAEVFDPVTGTWDQVPNMPFSKVQVIPTPYLADMLKPIATGMTAYRGKLCVPQSLYSWPFFVDVGGEMFNPDTESWEEMPGGMGEGWPVRQAGTKMSVVVEGELYAFDPSISGNTGKIKVYDYKEDSWKTVIEKVPASCDTMESESPCLLAAFDSKLHIVTKDTNRDITVMQADVRKSNSLSTMNNFLDEESVSVPSELETVVWKIVATRNFGSAELVNCQVIRI
jgi:hypothetical protein